MNRTVALLLLLLVVTNGAWMFLSDPSPGPAEQAPPAPASAPISAGVFKNPSAMG